MTRQELAEKTVSELCVICKEKGVTYYTHKKKLTKTEIINKLVECESESVSIKDEVIEDKKDNVVENVSDNHKVYKVNNKDKYIESIQIGVIVAFREPETNKLNTAKVIKKSTKNRKLKLQTQYGAEFIIPYESVVWVKTGTRFPRGIYNELKGIK